MKTYHFTHHIERGDDELEVAVSYTEMPSRGATYWQPAEDGEVEIIKAEFVGVCAIDCPAPLTDAEHDAIMLDITQGFEAERRADAYADYLDRRDEARFSELAA